MLNMVSKLNRFIDRWWCGFNIRNNVPVRKIFMSKVMGCRCHFGVLHSRCSLVLRACCLDSREPGRIRNGQGRQRGLIQEVSRWQVYTFRPKWVVEVWIYDNPHDDFCHILIMPQHECRIRFFRVQPTVQPAYRAHSGQSLVCRDSSRYWDNSGHAARYKAVRAPGYTSRSFPLSM